MAILIQITCFLFLLGTAHSWFFPSNFPDDSFDNNSTMLSVLNEMNKMMAAMHERFQYLMNSSPFPSDETDDRKQLDAIEPICNTTINSSASRRKKFRETKTTTCIKELILNGKKQIYTATNITDENGILITQSKVYQTISINTLNNTLPIDMNDTKDVITY